MDTESFTAGPDAHLLKALLEGAPTIRFTTIRDLEAAGLQLYDQGESEYLVCTSIPPDTFSHLRTDRSSILYRAPSLYLPPLRTARVKLASPAAACAAASFADLLHAHIVHMRTQHALASRGGPRHLANATKAADRCWGPRSQVHITCALEVAMAAASQPAPSLTADARLWLEAPDAPRARVAQVVTIEIGRDGPPEIVFRRWERSASCGGGQGTTHSDPLPQARCADEARAVASDWPASALASADADELPVTVTGSLTLSFAKLFGRAPVPGSGEADIVFSHQDLSDLARTVWHEM